MSAGYQKLPYGPHCCFNQILHGTLFTLLTLYGDHTSLKLPIFSNVMYLPSVATSGIAIGPVIIPRETIIFIFFLL